MTYRITYRADGILVLAFSGKVLVEERFEAIDAAQAETKPRRDLLSFVIDLSDADIQFHGAAIGLQLAEKIARSRRPFSRVAYVLRPGQEDMVATILARLYNPKHFRQFGDCDTAIAWLSKGPAGD